MQANQKQDEEKVAEIKVSAGFRRICTIFRNFYIRKYSKQTADLKRGLFSNWRTKVKVNGSQKFLLPSCIVSSSFGSSSLIADS